MLKHIVMYSLKDTGPAAIERMRDAFLKMAELDMVVAMEIGTNETDYNRASDFVCVVTFEDMDAYEAYQQHPLHAELLKVTREIAADVSFIDYQPKHLRKADG